MRPSNVLLFWIARLAPGLLRLPLAVMRQAVASPGLAQRMAASGPAPDREAAQDPEYRIRHDAVPDAFRMGTRAAAQELALFARPWGVELDSVTTPVHLWHGTADVNVPLPVGRALAQALPNAREHVVEGAAHSVGFERRQEVMQVIVEAQEQP
jgi:pimeloyl-ACP methyl ester carboxylesterase